MNYFTHKSDLILEALEMSADAQSEILACMNGRDYAEYTDEERDAAQAKLKDFLLARDHASLLHPHQMAKRIQEVVDAASPAGMISEGSMNEEIDARLQGLATKVLAARPDLRSASLDEWCIQHVASLDENERSAVAMLIEAMI